MSARRLVVPLLVLVCGVVCFAQNDPPQNGRADPNSVQRAITRARNEGRLLDAENLLRDAIHQLEQDNPQSPRLSIYLKQLANLVQRREGDAAAALLMKRSYEIDEAAFGPSDLRVGNDLVLLARYTRRAGDAQGAERQINQAVSIVRSKDAELRWNEGAGVGAGILVGAVRFYMDDQRWVDAELLMLEEMKLCKTIPDEFYEGFCGRPEETLAEIYRGEGKAVQTEDPRPGWHLPPELAAVNESAEKYAKDGLYPSAEETYRKAIELAAKIDAEHGMYAGLRAMEMERLGRLFEQEGLKDRAEQIYVSALEIGEQEAQSAARSQPGRSGMATGLIHSGLVSLYQSEGRLRDAEAVIRRVLEFQVTSLGERHRAIVGTLVELAEICGQEAQKEPEKLVEAKTAYERAIAIQEGNMGPGDPSLVPLLKGYAGILSESDEAAKAADVKARIASIQAHQPTTAR
jgi:tetratricopeptide (TPR) repeat protein